MQNLDKSVVHSDNLHWTRLWMDNIRKKENDWTNISVHRLNNKFTQITEFCYYNEIKHRFQL